MKTLLFLMFVVVIINLAPAFAPPTWSVLAFFVLNSDLPAWLIVITGAICAGFGRYYLARLTGLMRYRIKEKTIENLQVAKIKLESKSIHQYSMLLFFIISPLPSAQLFEAAGLIGVRLMPLTIAFFSGRVITYSIYVAGASQFKAKGIADLVTEQFTSVWAIIFQVVMILGVIGLGKINWSKILKEK